MQESEREEQQQSSDHPEVDQQTDAGRRRPRTRRAAASSSSSSADAPSSSRAATSPVSLLPSQTEHAQRLASIMGSFGFALDCSMLGAGKTYTATHLAAAFGFAHVVVVAPTSVRSKWTHMRDRHGLRLSHVLSYSDLRSQRCKQPKHGLLVRRDYTTTMTTLGQTQDVDKVEFTPTRRWREMVEEGALVIFDEVQNLKNVSSQFLAAQALMAPVAEANRHLDERRSVVAEAARMVLGELLSKNMLPPNAMASSTLTDAAMREARAQIAAQQEESSAQSGRSKHSKALLLSGSPFDRHEQVTTMLRCTGVMRAPEVAEYNPYTGVRTWTGMAEIMQYCLGVNPFATERVRDVSDLKLYAYDLFNRVLRPAQVSSMSPPPVPGVSIHKSNAFYAVRDPDEHRRMTDGVRALMHAVMYDPTHGTVDMAQAVLLLGGGGTATIQAMSRALLQVETAKLGTFVRVARALLSDPACPGRKVVICVNYNSTLADLRRDLQEFDPLVMNGAVAVDSRARVLSSFQAPDGRHRLLLGTVSVCGTGIDLDDKHGGFPRHALVSPNYSAITLYQLGQRFLRADTASSSTVHYVFAKHAHEENVLHALATKSNVMRETTGGGMSGIGGPSASHTQQQQVIYPGNYPKWHEPEEKEEEAENAIPV